MIIPVKTFETCDNYDESQVELLPAVAVQPEANIPTLD
jgi:hypothetical protein